MIPARVRRPRDKAKVESAVLIAERWILAVLRNRTFYSLNELHEAVLPLVDKINDRLMRKLKKSRRQLFEEIDKPALRPLPERRYELAEWKKATVNIDYHVDFEDHFYSVAYSCSREKVELRATDDVRRDFPRRQARREPRAQLRENRQRPIAEHMPASHREHAEWTPSRIIELGGEHRSAARRDGESRSSPAVRTRSRAIARAWGSSGCARNTSNERLERACGGRCATGDLTYRSVEGDPEKQPRPPRCADSAAGRRCRCARERARLRLLPLNFTARPRGCKSGGIARAAENLCQAKRRRRCSWSRPWKSSPR